MAAGDSKSLNSGMSIPQWMKNKASDSRFGFNEGSFSPPNTDDNFLYIRYSDITKQLKSSPTASRKNQNSTLETCESNYVNHTAPCQQYIVNPGYTPKISQKQTADLKIKSNGTDDGFKGEGAACGSSVVRVAHQMVSGKYPVNTTPVDNDPLKPKGFNAMKRRGSKSLPVTPISSPPSSPKSKHRLAHKYFTGPFVDNEYHGGSWILQGLLSRRDISQSIGYIAEESNKTNLQNTASDFELNEPKPEKKAVKTFKTKPCEFREMNFWSPTSM